MPTGGDQTLPSLIEAMADSMSYATANPYLSNHTHTQYYSAPHLSHGHTHVVAPPPRTEPTQRKRPKYTRSKTGCMTCRVKKIKCDETKPNCMRCTHGQRDCTWPEGVPARKKSVIKKESTDRPPTSGSSGFSESSTPPTRERTPPRRSTNDICLMPLTSRRPANEHYILHPPMHTDPDPVRRLAVTTERSLTSGYPHPPSNPNVLAMIPDPTSYPTQPRYDHPYSHNGHSSRHTGYRAMNHESVPWNTSSEYFTPHDRGLVASHIPTDPHTRYQ